MKTPPLSPAIRFVAAAVTIAALSAPLTLEATNYFVAPCGDDAHTGLTPVCAGPNGAKATIQSAVNVAINGDVIFVLPGTYNQAFDFSGKAITVRSVDGPSMTTLDGTGLGTSIVTCNSGEGPGTVLEGFTLTGGNSTLGGGMYNGTNCSPTVRDCRFVANVADQGAGILNEPGASPLIEDCDFEENVAQLQGGGIRNGAGGTPTIRRCRFIQNQGLNAGGGGISSGGANCDPLIENCLFFDNQAPSGTGAAVRAANGSSPIVSLCTFYTNDSSGSGGAVALPTTLGTGSITITNSILWGDTPDEIFDPDGAITVDSCNVDGGWGGAGANNINSDPLFIDPLAGDLRLGSCASPCVDSGDNTLVGGGVTTDLVGNPRFVEDGGVPDTGVGTAPIVDMGALEKSIFQRTYVTHGYQFDADDIYSAFVEEDEVPEAPGWVLDMVDSINTRAPLAYARPFSWNARSGNWGSGFVESAAEHLTGIVYRDIIENDLGHVHLIGHSRGSGVIAEVIRRLGALGIGENLDGTEIHMTMLDPVDFFNHPQNTVLETIQNLNDCPIRVYDNVTFADDYHRGCNSANDPSCPTPIPMDVFPVGTDVNGAHNICFGTCQYSVGHSELWEWYCETIFPNGCGGTTAALSPDCNPFSEDGYYWSRGGGGWNDHATISCRLTGAKSPVPSVTEIEWIVNGGFDDRVLHDPIDGWAQLVDAPVWTGYRWEEPICEDQWVYIDGVDHPHDRLSFSTDGVYTGAVCAGSPPADDFAARFPAPAPGDPPVYLTHSPILIPAGARTLRFQLRPDGVPTDERLRVYFDGDLLLDELLSNHPPNCYDEVCIDISGRVGEVGTLHFEYEGSTIDMLLDDIAISFLDCGVVEIADGFAINEVWVEGPGNPVSFIEVVGPAGAGLGGFTLLVIDGDTLGEVASSNFRRIVHRVDFAPCDIMVVPVDPQPIPIPVPVPGGYNVVGDLPGANVPAPPGFLEPGSQTYVLVPTAAVEEDGGVLTQLSMDLIAEQLIDAVATIDHPADHVYFGATVIVDGDDAADFMHRIPDALDTDSPADWMTQSGIEFGDPLDVSTPGLPNSATPSVALIRGDVDGNGVFNALADSLFLLGFGFLGGPIPPCMDAADVDDDGTVNALADSLYALGFGFLGGPPIPPPYPNCGVDPTPDVGGDLGCDVSGCP